VRYEWDERKRSANLAKHGVDFHDAGTFEWDTGLVMDDDREDYGESRRVAVGFIGVRLHVMAFTYRGETVRIFSLRKASNREVKRYVEKTRA